MINEGIRQTKELISVVLPAIDIAPTLQTVNFLLFFLFKRQPVSNMEFARTHSGYLGLTETPKYLIGIWEATNLTIKQLPIEGAFIQH